MGGDRGLAVAFMFQLASSRSAKRTDSYFKCTLGDTHFAN
jgi:hypothetical protein